MKTLILVILLVGYNVPGVAQSYKSSQSKITFFSSAPLEDIMASNSRGTSLFNGETGAIAFRIPIKGFQFRKPLMQQHFNENYLESDKFPQATFQGKLIGYDLDRKGTQEAVAEGTMTIHGVSRKVAIKGRLSIEPGQLTMEAEFPIKVADYDIDIPKVVFYNIAEEVEVTVLFIYKEN